MMIITITIMIMTITIMITTIAIMITTIISIKTKTNDDNHTYIFLD